MKRHITMAMLLGLTAWILPAAAAPLDPLTVVELFTSQGCSSCPPADRLLGKLAEQTGILALSFHVDYWNYLGWQDPFALPAATERQRRYARALGRRNVYTPEIVVQGCREAIGSDEPAVAAAIEAVREDHLTPRATISANLVNDRRVHVEISPLGAALPPSELILVSFDPSHQTRILRGENRGHVLVNINIVRSIVPLGHWATERSGDFMLPPSPEPSGSDRALLLQAAGDGRILGAARL